MPYPSDTVMDDETALMMAVEFIELTGTDSDSERDRDARGCVNQLLAMLHRMRSHPKGSEAWARDRAKRDRAYVARQAHDDTWFVWDSKSDHRVEFND